LLLSVNQALGTARQWSSIAAIGDTELPLLAVDMRDVARSFRMNNQDDELVDLITAAPWVNAVIVDDDLDPVFARLVDAFDVVIGDGTSSEAAVDVADPESCLAELATAVAGSPSASVALVQLLRVSHDLPIAQALHLESVTYAMLQTSERFQTWLTGRHPDAATDSAEQAVAVDLAGSLLTITLQRPDKRNALNVVMRDQLCQALELLDLDHSIDGALVVGAGSNFCAGGDLDEFGSTPTPATGHHVRMVRSLPALVHRVSKRVRVHVHGACVGAGIELPAFAGSIIAHPDATFQLPEIAFGLIPGAGGTVSVTRRCGRHRTAWLALTGTTIDAGLALRWQLIDRIDATVF
jgi:enoyl-CoA hydratase/carnithine racemase